MPEYFQLYHKKRCFDGPLTDYECSDNEEGQGSSNATGVSEGKVVNTAGAPEGKVVALSKRKLAKKESIRRRRSIKRLSLQKNQGLAGPRNAGSGLKLHAAKHRVRTAEGDSIILDFSMASDAEVTAPGWVGKTPKGLPSDPLSIGEVHAGYGLAVFPWDGTCVAADPSPCCSTSLPFRDSHLLLDRDRRVIGVLVGQPRGDDWKAACEGAYEALHLAASQVKPSTPGKAEPSRSGQAKCMPGTCGERRGISVGLPHGISMGPGQKVCSFPGTLALALTQHEGTPHAQQGLSKEGTGGGRFASQPLHTAGVQIRQQYVPCPLFCPTCLSQFHSRLCHLWMAQLQLYGGRC